MSGMDAAVSPPPVKSWRLVMTLTLAGLFSGLAIVGIYEITLPRITANKAAAMRRAVFEVVPGSERLLRLVWDGQTLSPAEEGEPVVYVAYDGDGGFMGYAIPGDGAGFQDNIKLIYGYLPDRKRVVGMRVLESRETPGLGDRIFKDQAFVDEFLDLAVEPEVVLIKGTGTGENEVDSITGATISSQAVVKIINNAHAQWQERLPARGQEPPAPPALEEPGS